MGQCRNLLLAAKVKNFKSWLENNGYETRETKASHSAFQVRVEGRGYEIYLRDSTSSGGEIVHASIYGPVIRLARRFLDEEKQSGSTAILRG